MSTAQVKVSGVGTRRPRDRKAQILTAAAEQFGTLGYSNANLTDIAVAVGITPGALYRHFRNKEALLAELTSEGSQRFLDVLAGDAGFAATMDGLVALAVSRRDIGVLWQREARNLPDAERAELRRRRHFSHQRVSAVIAAHRPSLGTDESAFLADAVLAVLLSPSYHRAQVLAERYRAVLAGMIERITALCLSPNDRDRSTAREDRPSPHTRRSRRELLLGEATRLFAERGFHTVTMDDIGHATGMAGPSIYNHFAKKDEILIAALNRGADLLDIGLNAAFAQATSTSHALHLALVSYIDLMTSHPHLVTIVVNETSSLTEPLRHVLRARQREYLDEWVHLLGTLRPEVDDGELRAIVLAAVTVVNIVVNSSPASERANLADELAVIGDAVLGLSS